MSEIRDRNSPYRVTEEFLPRFGARLQPEGCAEAEHEVVTASDPGCTQKAAPSAPKPASERNSGQRVVPVFASSVIMNAGSKPAGWWGRLVGWFRGPSRSRAQGSALQAVQTELKLDEVRPVRNDLSESDVPVVSLRSSSVPHVETMGLLLRQERNEGGGAFFRRATDRLLGFW